MPTYEYECPECGHAFEEFQSMSAKPIRKCPACGKNKVQRLIGSGGAVIFKGSGFYQTDYRSEGYKKAAQADKDSSSTSSSSSTSASSNSSSTDKSSSKKSDGASKG
jgi:putative FmdB family regulatory protein